MPTEVGMEIWHCPSPVDKKIADLLVEILDREVWDKLSLVLNEPYPLSLAEKYDLIYKLLGCKKRKEVA